MQRYMNETFGSVFPFGKMEEMGKQNMAMFEQAMKMFTAAGMPGGDAPAAPAKEAAADEKGEQLAKLQRKMEDLERQIGSLSDRKDD
jgi:polyhydroxyalkanoate synthesis regulator protein